jgi:hypothetical protein
MSDAKAVFRTITKNPRQEDVKKAVLRGLLIQNSAYLSI